MTHSQKTVGIIINLQSISDIITNSSSEVFVIYTKESIESFKEIISTLISDDFDQHFNLEILPNEYLIEDYYEKGEGLSFEDWCFQYDQDYHEGSPAVEGFVVTAKNPEDLDKAVAINKIYSLFESEERYY